MLAHSQPSFDEGYSQRSRSPSPQVVREMEGVEDALLEREFREFVQESHDNEANEEEQ